jgi:hypothetical protein
MSHSSRKPSVTRKIWQNRRPELVARCRSPRGRPRSEHDAGRSASRSASDRYAAPEGVLTPMLNGPDETEFPYDFFISRRSVAADVAMEVAEVLESAGHKVLVQDFDIQISANFVMAMHNALTSARHFIGLLTEDYDVSPFTGEEWTAFFALSGPSGGKRRLVILRIEEVAAPGLLASIVYGDLVNVTNREQRRQIILARGPLDRKTSRQPGFPRRAAKESGFYRPRRAADQASPFARCRWKTDGNHAGGDPWPWRRRQDLIGHGIRASIPTTTLASGGHPRKIAPY